MLKIFPPNSDCTFTALFNNTRTLKSKLNRQIRFSLPSIKCSEGPTSYDYCRTLFVVWTVHNDSITARSAAVESWEEPASIWLTIAKNAFVGWALNCRVRMLLKGAVRQIVPITLVSDLLLYFISTNIDVFAAYAFLYNLAVSNYSGFNFFT